MNKGDLVNAIAKEAGLTKKDAEAAVKATFDAITGALKAGDSVALAGFGTFTVKATAARTGVNPKTGEAIKIAAGKKATFKAAKALKDSI